MNMRILKKKSKQAAAILQRHYPLALGETMYMAEKCVSTCGIAIKCPYTIFVLKGTPMIGWMSGFDEPEFTEQTAYERLWDLMLWGGRPESMTDDQWRRAKRVTGITDAMIASHERWVRECANA